MQRLQCKVSYSMHQQFYYHKKFLTSILHVCLASLKLLPRVKGTTLSGNVITAHRSSKSVHADGAWREPKYKLKKKGRSATWICDVLRVSSKSVHGFLATRHGGLILAQFKSVCLLAFTAACIQYFCRPLPPPTVVTPLTVPNFVEIGRTVAHLSSLVFGCSNTAENK